MGVEIVGAESTPDQVNLGQDHVQDESIKFGAVNGLPKGETLKDKDVNLPKDAAEEWPEPKQIHNFYFIKVRPYDDPKLKAKIDQADKEIQKKNQSRQQITDNLRAKRSERANIISQLKPLTTEGKQYRAIIDGKRKEMEPFQAALGKLRTADIAAKNEGLCASEQELNERIRSLQFRLQHESNSLSEEKQLLKDIKYLEGTREKVIANVAMKAQLGDSYGQKEEMLGQVKQIGNDLDGVRKEQQIVRAKIKKLEDELKAVDEDIKTLQDELAAVTEKKDKAHEAIRELLKSREETNSCFGQNRFLLNNARELAAKKDVAALEELCRIEVEKFMAQWSSNKASREDYARRIPSSLDNRQLTKDGRMRNPGEKPIIVAPPIEVESVVPAKPNAKQVKDEAIPPAKHSVDPVVKAQKEEASKPQEDKDKKAKAGGNEQAESSDDYVRTSKTTMTEEIDPVQLKLLKVAEEKAKALQAQERKKKQAEKAAAKAAAKALKDEEKKQKEREKRARKKAGSSIPTDTVEETEADAEVDDSKEPEIVKEVPVHVTNANTTQRTRSVHKTIKPDRPLKVILKKKKSNIYWTWGIPGAIIAVVLALLAYYYTAGRTSVSQSS